MAAGGCAHPTARDLELIVAGLAIALVGIFLALEDVIPTPFR